MKTKQNIKIILLLIAVVLILAACSNFLTDNPNRSPSALLSGNSFTLYPGISQTMDARQSSDPDGDDSLSYSWEVISAAGTYTLSDASSQTPSFVSDYYAAGAASYTTPAYIGGYTLRLTVTDEYGLTDTSDVAVTVANLPPTASMSSSVPNPAVLNPTTLDCSSSSDPDPDRRQSASGDLHYSWSVIDSPVGSQWQWNADGYSTVTPFDPSPATIQTVDFYPNDDGVYTVRLTVTDEYGSTDTQTEIIPTSSNSAPALDVITNIVSSSGVLLGSGTLGNPFNDDDDTFSLDAAYPLGNGDDDTLTYTWTFDGFAGTIDLIVEGTSRTLNPGEVISTGEDSILTLAPDGAATPDGTADFSITITVSDASLDDTAVIWFDLY